MMRHLARLLWNRRRQNGLVVAEIFVAFLVLFAVVTLGLQSWTSARAPLGFDWRDRWDLSIERPDGTPWNAQEAEALRQVLIALESVAGVEGVAAVNPSPYSDANRRSGTRLRGRAISFRSADASDDYAAVAALQIVQGRWFSAEDDAAGFIPVVISQSMADELFAGSNPLGQPLSDDLEGTGTDRRERRVVGVIGTYRQDGEFMWPEHYAFSRMSLTGGRERAPSHLVLKMTPGTTAATEERLLEAARRVAPSWTFRVRPQSEMRAETNRAAMVPLAVVGIVASFLMLMVFLGLSGVMWQAITQRTREIGLRRAKGATALAVYRQLLTEIGLLTSVAVGAGLLLLVQLPWLDLVGGVDAGVYASSLAVTAATIYVLTLACGLYPGHLATKLSPAEALHDE